MANSKFMCDKWYSSKVILQCNPTTSTAGRSNNGHEQIIFNRNQRWRGSLTIDPIYGEDMLEYRGWREGLLGRFGTFDLCICDPYALKGEGLTEDEWFALLGISKEGLCGPDVNGKYGLPFSDGTCFSDGTGFAIPDWVQAVAPSGASEGDTSIDFGAAGAFMRVGNYFSTKDKYLHMITCVTGTQVTFNPPLRRNLTQGEELETQNPKIKVRLADDASGVPTINHGRWTSELDLSFEEALKR